MKHALKYLVLSTLIFSCGAGTMKLIEQLDSSLERAGDHAFPQQSPALYFHDVDGTIMNAKQTQLMLNDKGHTDRDGNVLVVDGAWGPKTIYAVKQYIGDCHGNDVMSVFGVK